MKLMSAASSAACTSRRDSSEVRRHLAAGDRREGAIQGRRHGLLHEADAAVAEEEVAAAGVNAVEAGERVVAARRGAAVAAVALVIEGGEDERVIHRLVE